MLMKNFSDLIDNGTVGDWTFSSDGTHILIKLPNQPEEWNEVSLPINLPEGQMSWKWNGNKESPTLTPSILIHANGFHKEWHGYLTDGKLITL